MKRSTKHPISIMTFVLTGCLLIMLLAAPASFAATTSGAASGPSGSSDNMKNNMMKMMTNKTWVKHVQRALVNNGADIRVDGMCGKKTIDAIRAFQKAHALKVTGMPNPETLQALGVGH